MQIHAPDFNLEATLDSGQVFGFEKDVKNSYRGAIAGERVLLRQNRDSLRVSTPNGLGARVVRDYFDLDRDLAPVYRFLREDERLLPALRAFRGLRLIHQDPWEALACFILSSNNNVKRIQGIRRNLMKHFNKDGAEIFPRPGQVAQSHEKVLRDLGLGYRAPFLFYTAKFVAANPECLRHIREAGYAEAKERVLAFPGIGEKVADCVLLYGFQKYEAFPVDVWILRAMRGLYFRNRKVPEAKVLAFGQKKWRQHAGYVQQYLFHAARHGIL